MNELVRIRNSHARRFEPGSKLDHATIARSSVSWTRSFAVSGSRQIRIATPYSSDWCGRHATANAPCDAGWVAERAADTDGRTRRDEAGMLRDMPSSKSTRRATINYADLVMILRRAGRQTRWR